MPDFAQARAGLAELAAARRALRAAEYELVARTRAAALAALKDGMAAEQVAAAAGVSADTVETWLNRARIAGARASIATTVDAKVLRELRRAGGPLRQRDIALATGLRSGTVSKSARRLAATGRAVRNPDGSLSPVSAKH